MKSIQWIKTNIKNTILGLRQELYKMSLEHLVVPESKDALQTPTMMGAN